MFRITPWGTWLIAAVCALMFAWETLAGGSQYTAVLVALGAEYGPFVWAGEWWRLVGATFLHIGIIHLAVNMYALLQVAPVCERIYGTARFLALYAVSGVTGSLAAAWFSDGINAGASGALFGVFAAIAVVGYRLRDHMPSYLSRRLTGTMIPVILFNLVFGFTVNNIGGVLIGNAAHIGGLIGGAIFALAIPPILEPDQPSLFARLMPALWLIALFPFLTEAYVAYRAVFVPGI